MPFSMSNLHTFSPRQKHKLHLYILHTYCQHLYVNHNYMLPLLHEKNIFVKMLKENLQKSTFQTFLQYKFVLMLGLQFQIKKVHNLQKHCVFNYIQNSFPNLCLIKIYIQNKENLKGNYNKQDIRKNQIILMKEKDPMGMLSFIMGKNDTNTKKQTKKYEKINKNLVLSSAMFWDSKKRVQKIKTLFLNSIGLKQFDDNQDFKVEDLLSIELLSLSKNQIIHLQPLSNLNTLISLNISHNKVYDISSISKLIKLEELYASNNQIKTIQSLREVTNLKTIQLYKNKIHNFKETFQTLTSLNQLTELDIQQNPVSEDTQYLELLSTSIINLKKLNGQLNKSSQKIKQMSSSKGFMNMTMKSFGTSTAFFNVNASKVVDPQKTLYDFCKKKASDSKVYEKRKQKENILRKLQTHYSELDEEFQKQIVKNVRIKNRFYKILQSKKLQDQKKEDNLQKVEEIKQLKRKVKAIKQQLFTKDKKGELLRKLFQVELMPKKSQINDKDQKSFGSTQRQTSLQMQKQQRTRNEVKWTRRFEADEIIVIESNEKYLQDETEEINNMLGHIQNTIGQLKSEIDYLS